MEEKLPKECEGCKKDQCPCHCPNLGALLKLRGFPTFHEAVQTSGAVAKTAGTY